MNIPIYLDSWPFVEPVSLLFILVYIQVNNMFVFILY